MTPLHIAVAKLRAKKGLTQQQLADLADVPQSRISEMERGVTKHVSLEVLEKLADALGVDPALLIAREAEQKATARRRRGKA